jgi:uncharacterized membrane protein YraQ (UPF0718 family)
MLSIAGLMLGPALVALGRGSRTATAAIDGLTLGVVPVLVLTRLLPHTMEALGGYAILLALVGFIAVSFAHRGGHGLEARIGRAVVVPTLFLHAVADGAGLAIATHSKSAGWVLGAALILHRLPEGLFVATALAPPSIEGRPQRTLLPVLILAVGTIIGALFGRRFLDVMPDSIVDGVVAFGLGAMLRLVLHTHAPAHESRGRAASGVAFVLGIALVLLLPDPMGILRRAQPRELSLVQSVLPLFIETAPAFLVGLLATGALHAYLPRRLTSWLRGGGSFVQAARGVAFGMPLPICSCGVIPVVRKLFVLGVPTAAIIAFAIATPEIGVDSALLSFRLLGVPFTLVRLVASVVLAFVVGVIVARFASTSDASVASFGPPPDDDIAGPRPSVREGFVEGLDHLGAWYVAGILVAAVFEATVDPSFAAHLPKPFDVLASVVLAIPVYVCAQGATPLAAMMVHKGFSTAAALALLLVGPATNLPILAVLRREIGTRAAAMFALTSTAIAIVIALLADRLIPVSSVPQIHPLVEHRHHPLEWLAAVALCLLVITSLLRMGPRGWFAAMAIETHEEHAHEHGCSHSHA